MRPKISVIMATYNAERFLDESIFSILNQTFKDLEFIIIDDHSIDSSLEVLKNHQKTDGRIKVIKNEKNVGLTRSLNKGILIAQGQYIARQDADDVSLPERLEKQFKFLEENTDVFLCGTNAYIIDDKGQELSRDFKIIADYQTIKKVLSKKKNCFFHTSIMFRNQNIFYREKFIYSQDYDLYLNLLSKAYKLENLKNKLVKSRCNREGISFRKNKQQRLFAEKARQFYQQRMKTGQDDYLQFDSSKILKTKNPEPENLFSKSMLESYFRNGNFKEAKHLLKDYRKTNHISFLEMFPYYICCQLPFMYKAYRYLFYK